MLLVLVLMFNVMLIIMMHRTLGLLMSVLHCRVVGWWFMGLRYYMMLLRVSFCCLFLLMMSLRWGLVNEWTSGRRVSGPFGPTRCQVESFFGYEINQTLVHTGHCSKFKLPRERDEG